jgi:signal peptidase I
MDPNLKISTLRELWQQTNEQHWLPVHGISMLPLLHEGDNILISHDLSSVRRGDILVFQQADGLVAHRVVRILKQPDHAQIYLTKGDNCSRFDYPLFEPEVLGRVNSILKNGREYDLTTLGWQFWNSLMATCHLLLGTFFQAIRQIKQTLLKKIT